eukprot:287140_1
MGQPLSVLTALFVFSATIHADCIHKAGEEKTECRLLKHRECLKKAGCEWKTTPPKSKTIVEFEHGRMLKSVPPIEAILEYIGDSVYYAQLRTHIPKIYNGEIDVL